MLNVVRGMCALIVMLLMISCGGSSSSGAPPLVDGSHSLSPGIASDVLPRAAAPSAVILAASMVDAINLMDRAEMLYPQYFPSHQPMQFFAPYQYRYYPETNVYLGVDRQYVRVLGPMFGPDIVTVGILSDFVCEVFPENCMPPTANAGAAQEVVVGATVTLDGSGTDANGASLTYSWHLVSKPVGSAAALNALNIAKPTFVADVAGAYVVDLTVSNGTAVGATATTTVTAKASNVAPTADAGGSRSVVAGTAVFLSGSLSWDGNGDPLTYQWTLAKPVGSNAILMSAATVSPYFTPDLAGTYVATLVVNDGKVSSSPATVSISATSVSSYCCKHCTTGKPCGDTCISVKYTCHTPGGCACY